MLCYCIRELLHIFLIHLEATALLFNAKGLFVARLAPMLCCCILESSYLFNPFRDHALLVNVHALLGSSPNALLLHSRGLHIFLIHLETMPYYSDYQSYLHQDPMLCCCILELLCIFSLIHKTHPYPPI